MIILPLEWLKLSHSGSHLSRSLGPQDSCADHFFRRRGLGNVALGSTHPGRAGASTVLITKLSTSKGDVAGSSAGSVDGSKEAPGRLDPQRLDWAEFTRCFKRRKSIAEQGWRFCMLHSRPVLFLHSLIQIEGARAEIGQVLQVCSGRGRRRKMSFLKTVFFCPAFRSCCPLLHSAAEAGQIPVYS